MPDDKDILKSYILDRVTNITNDSASFLAIRSLYNQDFHALQGAHNLGGGNLLMAIGLFAALEYISKIYYVLKNGWFSIPNNQKTGNRLHDEQPIISLIKNININLGDIMMLNENELYEFWKKWRHKLIHLLAQDSEWGIVLTHEKQTCFTDLEDEVSKCTSFKKINNKWECDADKLRQDIKQIAEWLALEIDKYPQNIHTTLEWLKSQWD